MGSNTVHLTLHKPQLRVLIKALEAGWKAGLFTEQEKGSAKAAHERCKRLYLRIRQQA